MQVLEYWRKSENMSQLEEGNAAAVCKKTTQKHLLPESECNTDPVPLLLVLQHPHLLLQPLAFPLQLLLPLARPLGLVARALQLRLQLLQLQVRQGVQAAGALKGQGRTVQHCEEEQRQSQPFRDRCSV